MQVVFSRANKRVNIDNDMAVALGNFDGLHIGHMELITKTINIAKKNHLKSMAYTFSNHPQNTIAGKLIVPIITPNEQKADILNAYGLDYLYLEEFNKELMQMTPKDFVERILVNRLNAKKVIVGFHYRFGYKNAGDVEALKDMGELFGFRVEVIEPVKLKDTLVSSSLIRELINAGDVGRASELLGRPYMIMGNIVTGKRLGNKIGFPTINIIPSKDIVLPSSGVYLTHTFLDGKSYDSITNVGKNPTVNDREIRVETHIIDFDGDVYGKDAKILFISKIRDEKKFNGIDELTQQIKKDVNYAKQKHHKTQGDGSLVF